ncbi:MAG: HIT domain-containing protein [Roseiflexaceae bacterium]
MEIKFTPWRMAYISDSGTPANGECVLCARGHEAPAVDNLVLYRGTSCYALMNLYPYNTGHLMIVPYQHTADLAGLDAATAGELFDLTRKGVAAITTAMTPHGFNIGMNLGSTAGAGIYEHMHMHIVPRWNGDANFMPIVGGTKLIPEALDQTYAKLRPLFNAFE